VIGRNGSLFEPALTSDVNRFTATMTNLLESNVVARTVIDDLGLRISPERLLNRLHVSSRPDSSVLEVSYRGNNKSASVLILRDTGNVFTRLVKDRLGAGATQQANGQPSVAPVTTSVFDPAHLEPGRVSPRPGRNLAIAGGLGLLLGLVLAFARESLDDRIRSKREAGRRALSPPAGGHEPRLAVRRARRGRPAFVSSRGGGLSVARAA
jgi:tyrosine-protein kinase